VKAEKPIFSELNKARILVVGDVMLDRYWFGDPIKVSDEAPVLVVEIDREKTDERPGGAGNVARNAAVLGADVALLSVVGEDESGRTLEQLLKKDGVKTSLHRDPKIATTVKLRILARKQQLLRVDFQIPPSHEVLLDKLADYERMISDRNVIILSDYGKGGLAHIAQMIELARAQGKMILVDPKGHDYSRYRGATLVTPNRRELRDVVGHWESDRELDAKAQSLCKELGLKALLVTLGEDGMRLYEAGRPVKPEKAKAREVFDVSGAGDTVIATLGVMLGAGKSLHEAVTIANQAAGIVVGKLGAVPVHPQELIEALALS